MMTETEQIRENYIHICERISAACTRAGRKTEEVTLVGVTKYVPTERIEPAIEAGLTVVGENHAQEFREKLTFYKNRSLGVRFIGQLQSNKLKYLIGTADCIDSIDRDSLLEESERLAALKGVRQDILLEVNIGEEQQKGGVLPAAIFETADGMTRYPHLVLHGLMCVPPAGEDARPYFIRMRELFDTLKKQCVQYPIDTLSMGMSADFETAVEEGATMVRVGSAIFGARGRK